VGVLHEPGHAEPWMIAMNCLPTLTAVLDYRVRWSMEPLFSDFQSRGFELKNSQWQQAGRLERRVLIMALAMQGCVRSGRSEATNCPTLLEKNAGTSRFGVGNFKKLPQLGILAQARFARFDALPSK
jgi:hypothetical protein